MRGQEMTRDYTPHRDPEKPRRFHTPKVLARMRAKLTEDRQRCEFHKVFGRAPTSDDELAAFVDEFTREMYNSGFDEIPE